MLFAIFFQIIRYFILPETKKILEHVSSHFNYIATVFTITYIKLFVALVAVS